MSGWFMVAVSCAGLAGACWPRSAARGLERLRPRESERARRRLRIGWRERLFAARAADQCRSGLVELADALAAELRAGAAPRDALWRAARDQPTYAAVAAAARSPAGDVVAALHELAGSAGGAAAADLATAWSVCEATGGRLAAPVARLAGAWRDDQQVRREITAQLAGPRATAWLLAGLPLAGAGMGVALGADPLGIVTRPAVAAVVLLPGLLLDVAGLAWTARITRRAATW